MTNECFDCFKNENFTLVFKDVTYEVRFRRLPPYHVFRPPTMCPSMLETCLSDCNIPSFVICSPWGWKGKAMKSLRAKL